MKLKTFIVSAIMIGLITTNVASAQTFATTSTLQELLKSLQAQVATLQAKMSALNAAQTQVNVATSDIKGTLKLISQLKQGATGEDVKLLQTILAADSNVYPEGIISGFFGQLTAKAVARFQKNHNLDQVGNVGPKTLEKLNEVLNKNKVAKEKDDDGNERHCAIVPPGHLIAPGWLRKHGGVRPIVPICQILPPGIWDKLNSTSTATSTPDTTAPILSSITVSGITTAGAHITWSTNELATSKVWYGTSTVLVGTSSSVSSNSLVINHDVALSGLLPNTTYYYVVTSVDLKGNASNSAQYSFTTSALLDTTAPIISAITSSEITSSSARITWTTDESANGKVWYGTSSPVQAASGTLFVSHPTLALAHNISLSNLAANTTYYYVVTSADATGNVTTSSQYSFTTLPLPDTTSPILSGISATNITSSTAHIVWSTNESADSKIWYSTSSPVQMDSTSMSLASSSLVMAHDFALPALMASTTYYYVISSTDSATNVASSSEYSFQTSAL